MVSSSNISVYFLKLISSVTYCYSKAGIWTALFFSLFPDSTKTKVSVKSWLLIGQISEGCRTESLNQWSIWINIFGSTSILTSRICLVSSFWNMCPDTSVMNTELCRKGFVSFRNDDDKELWSNQIKDSYREF